MSIYNAVPEVPFKPLNQMKYASTNRAMFFKDLIPMLITSGGPMVVGDIYVKERRIKSINSIQGESQIIQFTLISQ